MRPKSLVTDLITMGGDCKFVFRKKRDLTSCGITNARGGTRTRMGLPPRDFKSLASTGFATRASGSTSHDPPRQASGLSLLGPSRRPPDKERHEKRSISRIPSGLPDDRPPLVDPPR